ncbi:hypothetical protein [Chryseobacterium taihuense]|uniref:hypothetical protein n=1 Tax=Chryseobacterium taihuense TaxID=1141221 RepID=UPI001E4E49D8|nr:hypothetical protein [Chryseobacterium taihuense]
MSEWKATFCGWFAYNFDYVICCGFNASEKLKSLVEKVKLIDSLEEEQKSHIYAIIDMAVSNKRLKNTLTNALQGI